MTEEERSAPPDEPEPDGDDVTDPEEVERGASRRRRSLRIAEAVTGAGAISYALLHLWYEQFFEKFGLVPEDVGLDFTRVLTTSVTAILFGFGYLTAIWTFLCAPIWMVLQQRDRREDSDLMVEASFREIAIWLVLSGGFGALIAIALSTSDSTADGDMRFVAGLLAVAPTLILVLGRLSWGWARTAWRVLSRFKAGETALALGFLAVALGAGTTYNVLKGVGTRYANQVRHGRPISSPTLDLPGDVPPLRALDIHADLARVQWLARRPPEVRPGDCLLYLGSAGGTAILYDASLRPGEVIRVGQSGVVIGTLPDGTECARRAGRLTTSAP
ncbi:MAG TPA: hypothetical protein VF545_02620 [Thermoleophilaceae bacterium]|jgi:hypothetical protein